MTPNTVITYYNDLAKDYDADRFGNSYGSYIDAQEKRALKRILKNVQGNTADLGCGTGRLMQFANVGIDGSEKMLAVAREKFADKTFICADIEKIPFEKDTFEALFSFHVLMHLDIAKARSVFAEACRILKPGGLLIFDHPSAKRRNIFRSGTKGWHGNTAYLLKDLKAMVSKNFEYKEHTGILFIPVHRLPKTMRPFFLGIDNFLCNSIFKGFASYNVAVFIKK